MKPGLGDLLIDQLRDILHAEKQLTKALPKMAEAARGSISCGSCLNNISPRPKRRSNVSTSASDCLAILARAKPCKGWPASSKEGQEVIAEGEDKEDAAADLALIGAAQRVEHYEIAGYSTARQPGAATAAQSNRQPSRRNRWPKRKTRINCSIRSARSLMSIAKMPAAIERTE